MFFKMKKIPRGSFQSPATQRAVRVCFILDIDIPLTRINHSGHFSAETDRKNSHFPYISGEIVRNHSNGVLKLFFFSTR